MNKVQLYAFTSALDLPQMQIRLNERLVGSGIVLTANDVAIIAESRSDILGRYGRLALNSEVIEDIIVRFSSSTYIQTDVFVDTVLELYEIFQYIKHETLDEVFDDEILDYMEEAFNGTCQGSLQYLGEKKANDFIRSYRGLEDD